MNWNQTGMPAAMVSRLGRREVSEFKSVLNDAQNHVMRPVDVEVMAEWEEWDRRFRSLLG